MNNNLRNIGLGSTLDLYSSITKYLKAMNSVNNQLKGLLSISDMFARQSFQQSIGISSTIGLSAIQNMQNSFK